MASLSSVRYFIEGILAHHLAHTGNLLACLPILSLRQWLTGFRPAYSCGTASDFHRTSPGYDKNSVNDNRTIVNKNNHWYHPHFASIQKVGCRGLGQAELMRQKSHGRDFSKRLGALQDVMRE